VGEQLRAALEDRAEEMATDIRRLVEVESPTSDLEAVVACAEVVAEVGSRVTGTAPETIQAGGRPHLLWRLGAEPRVGLLGHFDTVWPLGTLSARPYHETAGRAHGPGIFDMKCGVVQAFYAAAAAGPGAGVEILLTSDEETGSSTSRPLIEEMARSWKAALVLEASQDAALKIARKGVSVYDLEVTGLESHAGLEPEKGINALVEMAHLVLRLDRLADVAAGTSVSPTQAGAGTAGNVIPAHAHVHADVRALEPHEQDRVDREIRALAPTLPGAAVSVRGGPNRPPMTAAMSAQLFALARRLYAELGFGELFGATVGGGSDGNFTAAMGVPTLDGLGAVGAGAHAVHEHILLEEVPRRAALVAALVREIST
jgi:glutamate carboxypeptidase